MNIVVAQYDSTSLSRVYIKYVFIDNIANIRADFPPLLESSLPSYSFEWMASSMPSCTVLLVSFTMITSRGVDPGGEGRAIAHPIINSMGIHHLAPQSKQYFCIRCYMLVNKHTKFSPSGHFSPPPNPDFSPPILKTDRHR